MAEFVWERAGWQEGLRWETERLLPSLADALTARGTTLGLLRAAGFKLSVEEEALIDEALTTAAIEGETLDRDSVRSSIARRLGLSEATRGKREKHVEGLVDVLLDATRNYDEALTVERLWRWHRSLFPKTKKGGGKIAVGMWRTGEQRMEIVSGAIGRLKVHFVAPPSDAVEQEMARLLRWWSAESRELNGLIRAGVAHFWFVTIHPFDDGNGRIARAISDLALAQFEQSRQRYYSLSHEIRADRRGYYSTLEQCQRGDGDVTAWLDWFLRTYTAAVRRAGSAVELVHQRTRFWAEHGTQELNDRQRKVIAKMLEAGPDGFVGGMTNRKYVSLAKTTKPTAARDLRDLVEKSILEPGEEGGRSANYSLVWPKLRPFDSEE